jgi:phage-related protein
MKRKVEKLWNILKKIMKYMARDLNDHVGIVKSVTNGVVNTIEGNSGGVCARRSYSMGSDSIYGYGVPAYLIL